jgi:hypothetical protein
MLYFYKRCHKKEAPLGGASYINHIPTKKWPG